MGFQEILEKVGGMGRFQIIHVILLSLPVFMLPSHNLIQNFTAAGLKHRCRINDSWEQGNFSAEGLEAFLPLEPSGEPSSCRRYTNPQFHLLGSNITVNISDTEACGDGWVYDYSEFQSTLINQWDLVCKQRRMKQLAQSIYMAGVLVGSIVFGGLSDKFGRKPLNIWSHLQMAVTAVCSAFAPNYTLYCVFRFLTGTALSGVVLNSYSLIVEWIPTKNRAFTSTATGFCYAMGQVVLVGLAYLIREWRMLQLAAALPFFIYFLYSWWIPESGRWLILTGKNNEAIQELKKVAKINGLSEEGKKLTVEYVTSNMQREIKAAQKTSYTVMDLVRTPEVRRISICISSAWFSTSFAYYGLALDLQKFELSVYIMQIIFGVVDFPAKFISYLVMTYIGRRVLQSVSLFLAGIAVLANIFIPTEYQAVRTTMAVFGKACLSASFNCLFLYTGELYPTVIRQSGFGLGTMMARLGGIVAPLAQITADYYHHLPHIIYGCSPIISGISTYFLPETLGVPLPETIQDVEGSDQRRKNALPSEKLSLKDARMDSLHTEG